MSENNYRYVHHNKCEGGKAIEEIDSKIYCYGRTDPMYEDVVYIDECKKCPRLYANNEEQIAEQIEEQEHEQDARDNSNSDI